MHLNVINFLLYLANFSKNDKIKPQHIFPTLKCHSYKEEPWIKIYDSFMVEFSFKLSSLVA